MLLIFTDEEAFLVSLVALVIKDSAVICKQRQERETAQKMECL